MKTNHSLRVAGASCLFDAGVPERTIQGHRSLDALRIYERVTEEQNLAVSRILLLVRKVKLEHQVLKNVLMIIL